MSSLPRPASCGRFHISSGGERTYDSTFKWVLPFHEPGLAPVGDESGAYHINLDGTPAYEMRFDRSFGFYCGLATVKDGDDWFHIKPNGEKAYESSWAWCGNFQQDRCTVRTNAGEYQHIRPDGIVLDGGPHFYAGDFKEGCAVVRGLDGRCRHIDLEGHSVYQTSFLDLDVFHKGFARARDKGGWFHIDMDGEDVSQGRRYSELELFYNGQALARTQSGDYVVINEQGIVMSQPQYPEEDIDNQLQKMSIAYWRPMAARLGILGGLAGGDAQFQMDNLDMRVMRRAWIELGLMDEGGGLTRMGEKLTPGQLWRDRILYWTGPQLTPWIEGELRLSDQASREDFFTRYSGDSEIHALIHRVLDSYAIEDWSGLPEILCINPDATVVDLGGGKGALIQELGKHVRRRILVDLPDVVKGVVIKDVEIIGADFFYDELPNADVYILSRVIHDWSDIKAIQLLQSIPQGTEIIVIDRIVENDKLGLLSLNMLLVNGGKERNEIEWSELFHRAELQVNRVQSWREHAIMWLEGRK